VRHRNDILAAMLEIQTLNRRRDTVDEIRESSLELWLALHGRAQLSVAMPWFELPDEDRYVDRLVRQVLG